MTDKQPLLVQLLKATGLSREHLAELLGVSTQTIHNWCGRRTPVAPRQLQRVADILVEAGASHTDVSAFAREELGSQGMEQWLLQAPGVGRTSAQSNEVVIAVWRIAGAPMLHTIASTCRVALEHLGYRCLIVDCGGSHRFVQACLEYVDRAGAAGVVLMTPGSLPDPDADLAALSEPFIRKGIGVVFAQFWSEVDRLPRGAAGIRWSKRDVARLAVETLADAGHTAIAGVFSGAEAYENLTARFFIQELRARGLDPVHTVWHDEGLSDPGLIRTIATEATAVFVDHVAGLNTISHSLYNLGLRWPEDMSILGTGGHGLLLPLGKTPLSIIEIPLTRMGRDAAQLLSQLIERQDISPDQRFITYRRNTFQTTPAAGGSVGVPQQRGF